MEAIVHLFEVVDGPEQHGTGHDDQDEEEDDLPVPARSEHSACLPVIVDGEKANRMGWKNQKIQMEKKETEVSKRTNNSNNEWIWRGDANRPSNKGLETESSVFDFDR